MLSKDTALKLMIDSYLAAKTTDNVTKQAYFYGFKEALRCVYSDSPPYTFLANLEPIKESVNNWDEAHELIKPDMLKILSTKQDMPIKELLL